MSFNALRLAADTRGLSASQKLVLLCLADYATRETEALQKAETICKQQEQKYLAEMANLKRSNADLALDTARVREQFDQLKSRRGSNSQPSDHRADRCEHLLSEAYELASEGEGLLRDRDARLNALK